MISEYPKAKYSLFAGENVQPCLKSPPVAHSEQTRAVDIEGEQTRTVDIEGVATHEEELQTKPRSPLTILSEDEGYLLEDEQIVETDPSTETCGDFPTSRVKSDKSKKKKKKKVASHRRSYKRPQTRPTNKLRWNMKKLLNPKLESKHEAVVISSSSSEKTEMVEKSSKGKGKRTVKPSSSSQPAETKRSQLVGEIEQPRSELFEIIAEIKDRLTKQQEEDKAKADTLKDHELDE